MSTGAGGAAPPPGVDPSGLGPELQTPFVERYGLAQRAEGILAPLLTTVLAFLVGGLVVIITTGKNPLTTYRAIFDGAGLSWFFEIGNHEIGLPWSDGKVWFPWNVNDIESVAAVNLQQTLIVTTTLIFTGLAVAFAFRCGLFNIGGQGQYIVGSIWAVWIGSSFEGMNPFLHITLAIVVATLAGAVWAGIAGFLKATVGAHEVISTIMLNWIAIWVGSFLFGLGGPLQNDQQSSVPISNTSVRVLRRPLEGAGSAWIGGGRVGAGLWPSGWSSSARRCVHSVATLPASERIRANSAARSDVDTAPRASSTLNAWEHLRT